MISLRFSIVWPAVLALALLFVYASFEFQMGSFLSFALLAGIAVCLLWVAVAGELRIGRPLDGLVKADPRNGDITTVSPHAAKEVQGLATKLLSMQRAVAGCEKKLEDESRQRLRVETALRDAETRYTLMVERANDGTWDWDLQSGAIEFSARWQGMLQFIGENVPTSMEEWKRLIHSDDNEAVLMRMQNHLEGLTPHFNAEYRVRNRSGEFRWIHSRGAAIRHASGKPYRMVMLDSDVHERKMLEDTIVRAAEGLSAVSGEEFFHRLMINLASVLGTRDNLACYCLDDPPTRARTLAYYRDGAFAEENFEYDLAGTSCGAVIERKEIVYCPTGVCDVWPAEKQYDRDSYLGVPMFDSTGKIIGHFACMDGKPMSQDIPRIEIFKIFAVRAAAELERLLLTRRLGAQATGS
jgi:PAS domain S-box-containing protein